MAFISSLEVAERLRTRGIKFITKTEIARLFGIGNANTTYKLLQRLEAKKILRRATAGIYLVSQMSVSDFEIANGAVYPSYVSLESALSHYGILAQFPFSISSVTTKRGRRFKFNNKEFEYVHVDPRLYWGFIKNNNFIMARPEKALLDMIYFQLKGLRKISLEELDMTSIDKKVLKEYGAKINGMTKYLRRCKLI